MIFHGKATEAGGRIEEREKHLYNQSVSIHYNETAYNNETLTMQWINDELIPILQPTATDEVLLALDAAAFHKTLAIKDKLKKSYIATAMVPSGCTGILQPLDTAVNKLFKELLREETELYIDTQEDAGEDIEKWTTKDKRVMVTHVVAAAWERFCSTKKALVQKAFKDVGLSIRPDGSEDHLLSIKGYKHGKPEIGDWTSAEQDWKDTEEIPLISKDNEFGLESESCISFNYRGLTRTKLRDLIIERGLIGRSKNRKEIVAILKEDDLLKKA